jgi:predicted nucleic acid-binding protein
MYQQGFGRNNNMRKIYVLLFFSIFVLDIFSQNNEEKKSSVFMDSAVYYLKNKQYEKSLHFYIASFSFEAPENPNRLYEAAVMAARTDKKDLSFMLLGFSVNKGFNRYEHILENKDFIKFNDERLDSFTDKIKLQDSILRAISSQLDDIFKEDQEIRNLFFDSFDKDSISKAEILNKMEYIDSCNLVTVKRIINEHGFWGRSLRTNNSRNAMWTTLQHSGVLSEYLNILRLAVKRDEIIPGLLALSEDRALLEKTGYQKYGSQYSLVDGRVVIGKLLDSINVDIYRKEMGLESLNDYIENIEKSMRPESSEEK